MASTSEDPEDDNVETFHFLRWGFDITALRALLERTKTPPAEITIPLTAVTNLLESDPTLVPEGKRQIPLVGVDVRWDHVDELPDEALASPVFVAPMGELGHFVIDGWHRIALARRRGLSEVPGLLLTRRQVQRVLLPRSAKLPPEPRDADD